MKRILYSLCVGSLALALTAWGAQVNDTTTVKAKAKTRGASTVQATTFANTGSKARTSANVAATRFHQRANVTAQTGSPATVNRNRMRNISENTRVRARNDVTVKRAHERNVVNRDRNVVVNRNRNLMENRNRNVTVNRNQNVTVNRNQNVAINRNQTRISFNEAVNLHRNEFHDRGWWRSHFDTIVFVNGGWYCWDAGWWFPAWGYAPGAYYPYDGPIYGYNGLTPDRVVVDVQLQLRRDGYYAGPIDGVLGPMTRRALTAFQADHGLAITSTIDEATLTTLGLS